MGLSKEIKARIRKDSIDYAPTDMNLKLAYQAGGQAEAERAAKLVEFVELFTDDPYPEKIFHPLTGDEQALIEEKLKQVGISLDRLAAHYGRIFRRPYVNLSKKTLAEYNNPETKKP